MEDPARFLSDPEYALIPGPIIDAHVHIFPLRIMEALWRWLETYAWPVRYKLDLDETAKYLKGQNVRYFCALLFSHKPELARTLNAFSAEAARKIPGLLPFGTVLPGEPEAKAILAEALDELGLVGIKIHCHTQKVGPADERMYPIYEALARRAKVLIIHAGREPASDAYGFDCYGTCGIEPVSRVVEDFPELKIVIPHLGNDQREEFFQLCRENPNVYLDTSMAVGGYLSEPPEREALLSVADKVLFGSDFPNLPFPWGREAHWLLSLELPKQTLDAIFHRNAERLFGLEATSP